MKHILITIFILVGFIKCKAQVDSSNNLVVYKNHTYNFGVAYPSQWDTLAFETKKDEFKVLFGALIKPDYKNNGTGGYLIIKVINAGHIVNFKTLLQENILAFKDIYPKGKVAFSGTKKNKNNLNYNYVLVTIPEFGLTRINYDIEFAKGKNIYRLNFVCPKSGFDKLRNEVETVIDSFIL